MLQVIVCKLLIMLQSYSVFFAEINALLTATGTPQPPGLQIQEGVHNDHWQDARGKMISIKFQIYFLILSVIQDDANVNIQVIGYNEGNVDQFDVRANAVLPERENNNDMGVDDIKMIHHPNARIEERVFAFDDYCGADSFRPEPSGVAPLSPQDLERPWRPFRTKLDFEVAEVVLDAHMNTLQTEKLLALIHEAIPYTRSRIIHSGQLQGSIIHLGLCMKHSNR